MTNWSKVGVDVLVGGAAGTVDQLIQNLDEKRGLKAAASGVAGAVDKYGKLPMFKQYGTYYNYGAPLVALGLIITNTVRDPIMATRLMVAGAELAGRKATHQMSTRNTSSTQSAAYTEWARREAREAAQRAVAAARAAELDMMRTPQHPSMQMPGVLVPSVTPQGLMNGIGEA